jgi:branched-chain amino acid transport system substrate-binding protein
VRRRGVRAIMALGLCAGIVAFALSAAGSAAAAGTPIKVGAIVSETGPAPFVDWSEGAKAYFNAINKTGGINGHPVDLLYMNDAGNPTQTSLIARQLIGDGIVAFVGSLSLNDCGLNREYYIQQDIVSIDIGGEAACFETPNMDPVNSGPKLDEESQLLYAAQVLHLKKNCFFTFNTAGFNALIEEASTAYTKITGLKVFDEILSYPQNQDVTPAVIKLAKAGCQSVSFSGQEFQAVAIMKAVQQQKITGVQWLTGLAAYSPGFCKASGNTGDGLIAMLEFEPFDTAGETAAVADFKASGYPVVQTMDTGWTAAWVFDHVVSQIKGAITRQSVTAAFKASPPFAVPTMGTPFAFGSATTHQSNHAAFAAQLKNCNWVSTGKKIIINYHY